MFQLCAAEVENLREHSRREVEHYADYMRQRGFYAEGRYSLGIDVVDEFRSLELRKQVRLRRQAGQVERNASRQRRRFRLR